MGDVLNLAKYWVFQQWGVTPTAKAESLMYNLFGDPSMQLWRIQPLVFQNPVATMNGANQVNVSTTSSVQGALVTLEQNGQPVGRGVIGTARPPLRPRQP